MKARKITIGSGLAVAGLFALGAGTASASGSVWYDTDGNGVGDQWHLDLSGDGYTDVIATDADENGVLDGFVVDLDANGTFETAAADTNGNGFADRFAVDTDGDMVWDMYVTDADENGVLDHLQGSSSPPAQSNDQAINDMMVAHMVTMQQLDIYYDQM